MSIEPPSTSATALGEGSGFFFSTPELSQKLDLLHHLVENSDRIPLLKGPDGVGKSHLLERFEQQAGSNWRSCRIDANLMLQPDQLFNALASCFEVPVEGPRLSARLSRQFEDLQLEGWLPVVLVDDAQQLPVETLAALLQLYEQQFEGRTLFRLVLFASPAIDDLILALQTQGMNVHSLQELLLLPLDREQTRRMLRQFLQLRGLAGQGGSDGQLDRLFRATGGLPGEALKLAAVRMQCKPVDTAVPAEKLELKLPSGVSWPALLGGGGVLLVVALTLLFQDRINALFEGETSEAEVPLLLPTQERVVPLQRDQTPLKQAGKEIQSRVEGDIVRLEIPEPVAIVRQQQSGRSASAGDPAPVDGAREAVVKVATETTPTPAGAPAEAGSKHLSDASRQADAILEVPAPPVADKSLAPRKPSPTVVQSPLPPPAASPPPPEPALSSRQATPSPATAKNAAPKSTSRAPVEVAGGVRGEPWLLRQKPAGYTLQLIGLRDEQAVKQFIERNGLRKDVAYFRTLRDNRAWFSVVYGVYPDRSAALAARRTLPGRLGRGDAWPRTLGSIQQLIKKK